MKQAVIVQRKPQTAAPTMRRRDPPRAKSLTHRSAAVTMPTSVEEFMSTRRFTVLGAVLVCMMSAGCSAPPPPTSAEDSSPRHPPRGPTWLADVTIARGLNFRHDPGPTNDRAYFMPRVMGSGGAVFDFDGDGRLDLYLVHNSGPNSSRNRLYQQQLDGRFVDVSDGSGVDVSGWGMGVAVADVNHDGKPDLLLTEYGATRLFLNEGNTRFREITRESGLDNPLWATSAAFFDYDRDGWLDLIVANYLEYNPARSCGTGGRTDFCSPSSFPGVVSRLFRHRGIDPATGLPRFEDVTVAAGLGSALGKGLGVVCADFNGDRWPDIFIANDGIANFLWINQRNGTFREEATSRGVAFLATGQPAANMGIALGDVDDDGLDDLFVTHLVDETHTLWRQGPRGLFQDRSVGSGMTRGWRSTGFGTALVDLDQDGWLDAVWVNGGVVRRRGAAPNDADFWQPYRQRHQIFANRGKGEFQDISRDNPDFSDQPGVGRALIVADLDNDGAPDLLTTEIAGPARIFRNVAPRAGHGLVIRAVLPQVGGRDAYGAEVTVRVGGRRFRRLVQPGFSYLCSSDPRVFVGLADASSYDDIEVIWPDGSRELFPGGTTDRAITLRQGEGTTQP